MSLSDEKDARAFRKGAGLVEALVDSDVEVAPQHLRRPRKGTPACGATSGLFFAATHLGVTCPDCLAVMRKR